MFLTDGSKCMPYIRGAFAGGRRDRRTLSGLAALLVSAVLLPHPVQAQAAPPLLDAMTAELHRAFTSLGRQENAAASQMPPYFLSYSVSDADMVMIQAQYGALVSSNAKHARVADVQIRVGGAKLDNTHGTHRSSAVNSVQLPLTDDAVAIQRTLWRATNAGYSNALDNFLRVKTEAEVRAKEEDASPDFSEEKPQTAIEKPAPPVHVDRAEWEQRTAALSKIFREFPDVYQNVVILTAQNETDYFA